MAFALTASTNSTNLLLSIHTPTLHRPVDTHTCVVLDISGSMNASLESSGGERSNLSRLNIAIHAIKTLIVSCDEKDVFSLVVYSGTASVSLNALSMTEENKKNAFTVVDKITPGGSTNMWAGMEKAFEILERTAEHFHNQHMLVLTDGDRPDIPDGGFVSCMQTIKARREGKYPCVIHTFGFAYQLDSHLLVEIAKEGNGMYSFIPDGSMVGTVFINSLSNSCTTCAHDVRLMVDTGDVGIASITNVPNVNRTAGYVMLDFPTLAESRRIDILIVLDRPLDISDLALSLTLKDRCGTEARLTEFTVTDFEHDRLAYVIAHDLTVRTIEEALAQTDRVIPRALEALRTIRSTMTDNELMEAVDGLISDIDGQVTEAACNLRYYMRWGKHYLPSLIRAHVLRQCNNFKDPGIQTYSSPLFEKIRGDAEAQFAKLPPPKPAVTFYQYGSTTSAATVNMSQYIDRAGGCIHGDCLVLLQNEQYVAVSDIKKGAQIKNGGIVKCVVKTPCSPNQEWIQYGDLIITAWHPVFNLKSGWWEFPCNIPDATKIVDNRCEFMYSFVMEGTHYIEVEGIYCASLGHGVLDNEVLAHEFLGTNKVLDQLRECRGYENGEVTVQFTRSNASGRLDGLTDIST